MHRLSVTFRLALAFGAVLLLLTLSSLLAWQRLAALESTIERLENDRLPKLLTANLWIQQVMETARHTRNMLILDDPAKVRAEIDATMADKALRKKYVAQLRDNVTGPEEQAALQAIIDKRADYTPFEDDYLRLVQAGQLKEAKGVLLDHARPTQLEYIQALRQFIAVQQTLMQQEEATRRTTFHQSVLWLLAFAVAAVLAGVGAAWVISRGLLRQLGGEPADVARIADAVANGDLSRQIPERGLAPDSVMAAMARMQARLRDVIAAQTELARRHQSGEISYRIDADALPGAYGELAGQVNGVVHAHLDIQARAFAIVAEYARGG